MKNKNKTIVESKKGSLSKKIGRIAIISVLYIALMSTLAFFMSLIVVVNADTINGGANYYGVYTPSSMNIYTSEGNYFVGSNDVLAYMNGNDYSFDDYYSIADEEEEEELLSFSVVSPYDNSIYSFNLPSDNITLKDLFLNYGQLINTPYSGYYYVYASIDVDYTIRVSQGDINGTSIYDVFIGYNDGFPGSFYAGIRLTDTISNGSSYNGRSYGGSNDDDPGTDEPGSDNEFWRPTDEPGAYSLNRAVGGSTTTIKRVNTATFVDNAVVINNNNYNIYRVHSEIVTSFIGVDFVYNNDFVVNYNDFGTILYNYSIGVENDFSITKSYRVYYYDEDSKLVYQDIVTTDSYIGGLNTQVNILPLINEIENATGLEFSSFDSFLIQDLYVQVTSSVEVGSTNSFFTYWSAVNSSNYDLLINDRVNNFYKTTKFDIGSFLLNSVNGFLDFEIVPGLSLMNILILLVAIPLLIWILRLFLGG